MSELTKEYLIQKINPYLKNHQPGGISLEIVPEGIRRVDNWWRIPVRLGAPPKKLYEYYEALAEIEQEIDEKESLNVVLTTSDPEEDAGSNHEP